MELMQTLLLVLQVFVALTLIGFILIQHGKGADAGAAFGSGSSGTVFGSQGSGNFMTKTTTVLAVVFLINSLALGYLATQRQAPTSLIENTELVEQVEQDAVAEELGNALDIAAEKAEAMGEDLETATDSWDPATTVESETTADDEDLPALPQ